MVFWGTAATALATKREQLLSAERKLLQLMVDRCTAATVPSLEAYDTTIPADCISLSVSSNTLWCRKDDDDDDKQTPEDLIIHGIQVTANHDVPHQNGRATTTETKPLVLLHGYMNGGAYFYRNLMGLSQFFSKIHALDLLGWGLSSRPNMKGLQITDDNDEVTATEDFFVESLEAWRQKNKIDSMILAGHSMGGYLSVAYAERYPERVERLILISPVGVPEETDDELQRRNQRYLSSYRARLFYALYTGLFERQYTGGGLLRTVSESRGRGWIHSYVTRRLPSISDPEEQTLLTDYLYHNNTLPGSGEYCVSRLLKPSVFGRKPLQHRIAKLQVQSCSFLYGDNDWMDINGGLLVQESCAKRKQDGLSAPAVNVYKVSEAGHLLMLENWKEFNHGLVMAAGLGDRLPVDAPLPSAVLFGTHLPQHLTTHTTYESESGAVRPTEIQVSSS